MSRIAAFVRKEFREILPPTIFFFLALNLIAITSNLMLASEGVPMRSLMGATLGALIVAKVLLVADHIPLVNRFPDKPLIYNICWKTAIYLAGAFLVRFAEALIREWPEGAGLSGAVQHVIDEVSWPRFLAIQIWLLVLLFMYAALRELFHALGRERVLDIVFRRGADALR